MMAKNKATTVAVVVHNNVARDARVLKEVRSLSRAGLDVTVFGISDEDLSFQHEGSTVRLSEYQGSFLKKYRATLSRKRYWIVALIMVLGGSFIAVLSQQQGPSNVNLVLGLAMVLAGFCYLGRRHLQEVVEMIYRLQNWHAMARVLEQAIEQDEYDVVHCHDIIGLIAGSRSKARKRHLRLIWDAHEIYEEQGQASPLNKMWLRVLLKRYTRNVDAFITINESIKTFYQQHYSLPSALVVMNATVFGGRVVDDGRLRKASRLDERRKILLFQGGFSDHRGIPQLMEAARNLPQPWSIVMMGWGKAEAELKVLAWELEQIHGQANAPLVVLPPASQEELPFWTAGADLGVIPYEDVGLNHLYCTPNKLWEYPNAGVPILATSLVEMEKMITEWGTGFLLPRDFSGSDIIRSLEKISAADFQEKRANCADFSERLAWQKFEGNLLKAYNDA